MLHFTINEKYVTLAHFIISTQKFWTTPTLVRLQFQKSYTAVFCLLLFCFLFYFFYSAKQKLHEHTLIKRKNLKTWDKAQCAKDRTKQHISAQTSARHTVITPEVLILCKYKIHILVYKTNVCKTQANIKILKLYKITYQNKYGHKIYLWLKVDSL